MKKVNQTEENELRSEYKLTDFPGGMTRGKFAKRIRESSNIVVLKPEVAEAFPNEDAVNDALSSLIELARRSTKKSNRLNVYDTGVARKKRGLRSGKTSEETVLHERDIRKNH
jgi:hypothetical protein